MSGSADRAFLFLDLRSEDRHQDDSLLHWSGIEHDEVVGFRRTETPVLEIIDGSSAEGELDIEWDFHTKRKVAILGLGPHALDGVEFGNFISEIRLIFSAERRKGVDVFFRVFEKIRVGHGTA